MPRFTSAADTRAGRSRARPPLQAAVACTLDGRLRACEFEPVRVDLTSRRDLATHYYLGLPEQVPCKHVRKASPPGSPPYVA